MSREISLVYDYDGVFKDRVEIRDLRVEAPPAALPTANLRLLRSHLLPKEGGYPLAVLQHYLTLPLLVISSGGKRSSDTTVKNSYSYDESRDLPEK
jgi:hypothetical protein